MAVVFMSIPLNSSSKSNTDDIMELSESDVVFDVMVVSESYVMVVAIDLFLIFEFVEIVVIVVMLLLEEKVEPSNDSVILMLKRNTSSFICVPNFFLAALRFKIVMIDNSAIITWLKSSSSL